MIKQLGLKKIFCWLQENEHTLPHGLAMGEDGVMLGLCAAQQPEDIMRDLSYQAPMFDDHFGRGNWELVWVPSNEVHEVGLNLDFEMAMGRNALLAQQAGLKSIS